MIVEISAQVRVAGLGPTREQDAVRLSLFSAHADHVELCLFDRLDDATESRRVPLEREGDVWTTRVEGLQSGTGYGYRVHGPFAPDRGHRFNPSKLLLDPYGRAVVGTPTWQAPLYDHDRGMPPAPVPSSIDSAPLAPRSLLVEEAFDWEGVERPLTAIDDSVLYEVHVKGFTARHPAIPPELRGTYLGLAHPAATDYLTRLGVTAVELLPVHAFVDDAFLVARGLRNYWGYNSIGYFAPDARYASSPVPGAEVTEFKTMVRELHRAGIEVLLDVVYNHTGETDDRGPTLSFRGIDNAVYYRLDPRQPERYVDVTGCGNTLQVTHPVVRGLILDSLRYWVETMGVDGFRFDLAPALGRNPVSFDAASELLEAIRTDPVVGGTKLIAESWDLGADGYHLGRFSPGWSEWNDQYRDTVRNFWVGSDPQLQAIGARLTGSADLFRSSDRLPSASVNFLACHDGFTLADAIAYPTKRNAGNGDRNRDGSPARINGASGQVGPTRDGRIVADRRRMTRSMLTMLLCSQGVPMLLGGDEIGRTQGGNNNAYCHDNERSWFDWDLTDEQEELRAFVATLVRVRRDEPLLRLTAFAEARAVDGPQIRWFNERGAEMAWTEWQDHDNRRLTMTIGAPSVPYRLALLVNASDEDAVFALPGEVGADLETVERVVASWETSNATDPVELTPAGSIQLLRLSARAVGV